MYITKYDTIERLMKDKHNISFVGAVGNRLIRLKCRWSKTNDDCIEIYKVDETDDHKLQYANIGEYRVSDHSIMHHRALQLKGENLQYHYQLINDLFTYCWDDSIDECEYDVMIIGRSR